MKLLSNLLTGTSTLLLTCVVAHADPAGMFDRGGSFALFDVFTPEGTPSMGLYTPYTVTNLGPLHEGGGQATRGSDFSATVSVNMEGGRYLTTGGIERLYQGIGQEDAPFVLSVDGVANTSISELAIQLKFSLGQEADVASFFNVTLNGASATSVQNRGVVEGTSYNVVEWIWTELTLEESNAFTFAISGGQAHASLDAVRIEAIPEPSTYALLALTGAGIALVRRRRKSA